MNYPSFLSWFQQPSRISPSAVVYLPAPCFLFMRKLPTYTSPFEQLYFPNPLILSSLNSPQYFSLADNKLSTPFPCFLFCSKSPSQLSPTEQQSFPFPWNFPSEKLPSYFLFPKWRTPWPCRSLLKNYPSYRLPFLSSYTPLPCFFPSRNPPLQQYPFPRSSRVPFPQNLSSANSPVYFSLFFVVRTPFPCFSPFLKEPQYLEPSRLSQVPWLNWSFSKDPTNLSPSANMYSPLGPLFSPLTMQPLQKLLSAQLTVPFTNSPLMKLPRNTPFESVHTPSPSGLLFLRSPSYTSPFQYWNLPRTAAPASKVPLKKLLSEYFMEPEPCGRPSSSHSPSQRVLLGPGMRQADEPIGVIQINYNIPYRISINVNVNKLSWEMEGS